MFLRFLLLLSAGLALTLCGCGESSEVEVQTALRQSPAAPPVAEPPPALAASQRAFIEVSERVTPAVVNISAARRRSLGEYGPLFEQFFGEMFPERPRSPRKEQSLGSGFLFTADGYILTNTHVIEGAEEIKVRLSDARVYPGRVVGSDDRTDVAVLKIDAEQPLSVAVLGDSDEIRVGQWALAIGNPFGLDRTVTVGVISATGRSNVGIEEYEDFLQTDASINPGNSGGPLLNIYGEVVGINTAIVSAGQGIGFAIPINLARHIADQLIENGAIRRGWLGVRIQALTPELAATFGLDRATGALVTDVLPDSPAALAGLRRGDIILSFAGREVRGVRELQLQVASARPGEPTELVVQRDQARRSLTITLTARDETADLQQAAPDKAIAGLGFEVTEDASGVRVTAVDPESAAARAGLRVGDRILQFNDHETPTGEAFRSARAAATDQPTVRLLVQRGEAVMYLAFTRP